MARPRRTRGVRKRYTETPVDLDSDGEPLVVPDDQSADGDFDSQAEAHQPQDEEDDEEDAAPISDDDDGDDDPEAIGSDEDAKGQTSQQKKQRNGRAGMIQSRKGFHDIPHYPLETRIVTRVYGGPLRRYARYSALRDIMFGPEYDRIKIIWDLDNRWVQLPLLPSKRGPNNPCGIVPSPWLPPGFEINQQKRALQWYDEYQERRFRDPQPQTLMEPPPAQLGPQKTEGDLITLVGPWDEQKEVVLRPGSGVALSPTGLPLDGPESTDETPSGWQFDVGGIPLATAWAPSHARDTQLLAVAVIPFSDQAPVKPQNTGATEEPDTIGCIQFWEFARGDQEGVIASPSRHPPTLILAKIFGWGRPKRLQWCPVPFNMGGLLGLLAVLCGDGKARVIEVKKTDGITDTHSGLYP